MYNVELARCCMLLHFVATVGVDTTARAYPLIVYVVKTTQS